MKLPRDVIALLERRYDSRHREWLAAPGAGWPLVIALGAPSEQEALRQVEAVREWTDSWRQWKDGGVAWVTRQWKILGAQQLPLSVTFESAHDVARCIGQHQRWTRAAQRFALLTQRWPGLAGRLARTFAAMADYDDDDFTRLLDLLAWLEAHPASGLYPRQVPVAGIDSKWLEGRKAVLAELLLQLRPGEDPDFHALSGLRRPPALIRMRVLDPDLRARLGGLDDLAAPLATLMQLQLAPTRVLVVENLQTGLALPDLPGTVAFMGLGYAVDLLRHLAWLGPAAKLYWGDLDTHGFAILNQARTSLPDIASFLMDRETLLHFRHLASDEPVQVSAVTLAALNGGEAEVFAGLKSQRWGSHVRLEQERIPWSYVLQALTMQ